MYNLNENQVASLENFEGKIPESLVKSRVEKLLAEITPTNRMTGEQMEQLVALATHLPKDLQNFPIAFAQAVKNTPETERREAKEEVKEPADLLQLVDDSIENVGDVAAPDNKEETTRTLGKKKGTKGVKKKAVKK